MKKICIIGQFPPPIHGLSKALDTIYNSKRINENYKINKINITNNYLFVFNCIRIIFSNDDLYYFTISQTKYGNIRDLILLYIIHLKNKKCFIHLHGGYYRILIEEKISKFQRKLNYNIINKLNGCIVLGQSLVYQFEGLIESSKIFVIPNCIDDEFLPSKSDIELKLKNSPNKNIKDVLYLSNFIKSKGYEYVLMLAKIEKNMYNKFGKRHFHFHFAGKFIEKDSEKIFNEEINKNELNDFITYHGIVYGESKKELLFNSDVFILLTTYPKEGQPISILEAMGNGLIIVTTNHSGIPDIVNKECGLIYNKTEIDCNGIYNDLVNLFSNNYSFISKKNYELVSNNYLEENYINNINYIFKK